MAFKVTFMITISCAPWKKTIFNTYKYGIFSMGYQRWVLRRLRDTLFRLRIWTCLDVMGLSIEKRSYQARNFTHGIDLIANKDAILKILSVDICGKVKVNSDSSSKTVLLYYK